MDFGITVVGFSSSILEKGVVDQAIKRSPKDIYVSLCGVFFPLHPMSHTDIPYSKGLFF